MDYIGSLKKVKKHFRREILLKWFEFMNSVENLFITCKLFYQFPTHNPVWMKFSKTLKRIVFNQLKVQLLFPTSPSTNRYSIVNVVNQNPIYIQSHYVICLVALNVTIKEATSFKLFSLFLNTYFWKKD